MTVLIERLSHNQAKVKSRIVEGDDGGKNMFMEGIFVQGNVKNANQRVYPVNEIAKAVESVQKKIEDGFPVLGECDHPPELTVNVDRVSHIIESMWMDGPNGYGKLKIVPTPMGNIIRTLIESGATLGVSSRGSGEVGATGEVKNFEIVTVDIVAQPSAPEAYPKAIYEGLMNMRGGYQTWQLAQDVQKDKVAQKYLSEQLVKFINELKL
ncbi:MAG: hypothetical protein CBB97_15510 [Candidatus Endolissoclinum sp. TMED37]|jgi:hypothetical protein|nr:MAG: hypothetical protein CBB97_15510 [Candidatus Endolissoclinum sp. TMED37]|tara:strand:+ start:79 stop:708 length:630 start_codon:yes stop_codon:yes gene_type:complete